MINHLSFTGGTKLKEIQKAIIVAALICINSHSFAQSATAEFNAGNYQKALQIWNQELEKTPDSAQLHYNLALLFDKGLGMEEDASMATQHYIKAANLDYAPAMFNLGVLMAKQDNYASAAKWWLRASNSNLPEAQYNLAKLYFDGLGVEKDLYKAKYWFKQAAQSALTKYDSLNTLVSSVN